MPLPSPTLLSMEVLTHVYPLLKHLFSKIFPMAKTFPTCLKTTYKRSKCLALSRRVQDPSATRTEANVFLKTSTMEQISETTDRLGSERDVVEGSYLRSFTSGRRISQSNISSREGGWGQQASNQSKIPQQICASPAFQDGGFPLTQIYITEWRLHVQNRFKRVPEEGSLYEFLCLCFGPDSAPRALPSYERFQC